jgi:hypothetical protein
VNVVALELPPDLPVEKLKRWIEHIPPAAVFRGFMGNSILLAHEKFHIAPGAGGLLRSSQIRFSSFHIGCLPRGTTCLHPGNYTGPCKSSHVDVRIPKGRGKRHE